MDGPIEAAPKAVAGWPQPARTIELWPAGPSEPVPPGLMEVIEDTAPERTDVLRRRAGRISRPRIEVFPAARPNGGAMLIIPGGGFAWDYFDHEGYQLAALLAGEGITSFVLFYRLATDGWANRAEVGPADAQRALRVIADRSAEFAVDPGRIGVIGFSAGGFLAASMLTRSAARFYERVDVADDRPARPFLAAPIYPVQSLDPAVAYAGAAPALFGGPASAEQIATWAPERNVAPDLPPSFLAHAEDDAAVPVANSTRLREALLATGNVVETHLFARGGHGFGMDLAPGHPCALWPQLFLAFARREGLMGPG